jgi:hypothetical protein
VHDACLEADLDVLPNGDMTEVGERVRKGLICSWPAVLTQECDVRTGYITFWWAETTCQHLSRHLLWVGHSDI